jgi:hypothetical protein
MKSGTALRPQVLGVASLYAGLAALVFFLAFCNLDGHLFWEDEAENALLAKNIVRFGVPVVNDGVNDITQNGDAIDARHNVWSWAPWLPEYVTAASFAVFGPTTWAGRAPFALLGWGAVLLLSHVAWRIYRSHRIALGCMLLLGTSELFVLHMRQSRYYSIIMFAEILVVYGIGLALAQNRRGPWFILAGLLLQFYCNYIIATANAPILMILTWNLFRQKSPMWRPLILSGVIAVLLATPWLLFTQVWRQPFTNVRALPSVSLPFYVRQMDLFLLPWCFLLLPLWGWVSQRFIKKTPDPAIEISPAPTLATVPVFEKYLLLLIVLYVPILLIMPGFYSRYLLPLLPITNLLIGAWIFRYLRWTALAIVVLILQSTTNLFAAVTNPFKPHEPVRSHLVDIISSDFEPYDDRMSDVVRFFNIQAHPGDMLLSEDPELPLIFYTKLRVINARITAPPAGHLPDWILPDSPSTVVGARPLVLPDFFKPYYQGILLTVHDSRRGDTWPEPGVYQYHTASTTAQFVIYQLKTSTNSPSAQR